jgi:phosphatidylserine decarboxylase
MNATTLSRYGGWLPSSRLIQNSFINNLAENATIPFSDSADDPGSHEPAVSKFRAAIVADPEMVELWKEIFRQASSENKILNFEQLLAMLDQIIVSPPQFHIATDEKGNMIGEPIGVPIYLLFDLLGNTGAAFDLFRKPAFNNALKDLLDSWGQYLTTTDSNKTLNTEDKGWFSPIALEILEANNRGKFNATYECPQPDAPHRGFPSWDAFFTRKFKPGVRPVDASQEKALIHSACESTVYRIAENVKVQDRFWLKGQAYSLCNMLKDNTMAESFVGGTVYQAFLSPQDYHRWHSPVDGRIVNAKLIPGTYYAVLPDAGAEEDDPDLTPGDPRGALIRSQAWITQSAARAVVYIQANNPDIGLIAFIAVGMAEVSTCELTVSKGQKVSAGQELGMFHFGGSSHTLIFGPDVKITFADHVKQDQHLKLSSVIAQASRRER